MAAVVAWWLTKFREEDEESEAAAAPAMTTERANTRTTSFIKSYSTEKSD
jgi:hypothetical protein